MSHRSFLKYTLRGINGVEKSVAAGKQIRIASEFPQHSLHKQIENKKQVTGSLARPTYLSLVFIIWLFGLWRDNVGLLCGPVWLN